MKTNTYVQFNGKSIDTAALTTQAKDAWKQAGNKVKDIKTLDIYVKPEESKAYYAINETEGGAIEL